MIRDEATRAAILREAGAGRDLERILAELLAEARESEEGDDEPVAQGPAADIDDLIESR